MNLKDSSSVCLEVCAHLLYQNETLLPNGLIFIVTIIVFVPNSNLRHMNSI